MNILLIQPPRHPESLVFGEMEPLALEVLSACLKNDPDLKSQINVKILDLRVEKPDALFKMLNDFRPQIIGLTGITIDYPKMIETLKIVKKFSPDTVTIVGGHHATVCPQEFFLPLVDQIICGPGVKIFPDIIKNIINQDLSIKLPGVHYNRNDKFEYGGDWSPNLDYHLPFPDREATSHYRHKYKFDGFTWAAITTTQGCPFRCTFCACWQVMRGHYNTRSAEEVVEELSQIPEKRIFFGDDHTFANVERMEKLYRLIKERNIEKIYQGYCRADLIVRQPELFKKWAEIGLYALTVGFEALTDEELANFNKKGTIEINEKANKILAECGIHNYAHILIKPNSTRNDFQRVLDYTFKLGVAHPVFPVLTPLPGTDLRKKIGKLFPNEHQYYDLAHPLMRTTLPAKEFFKHQLRLLRINYSFKRWVIAKIKKIINKILQKNKFTWEETNAPEIYTIPIARIWLHRLKRRNKNFLKKFSER